MVGGRRPGPATGFYYAPTVLLDVPPDAEILGEEIFGPVAPVVTFTDEADAIRMANDTEYGLVSYVYTCDLARGLRVSERLDAGMVGLNRGLVSDPAAPFGGTKQSGIGREGGHEGMLDYLETKYVAVQLVTGSDTTAVTGRWSLGNGRPRCRCRWPPTAPRPRGWRGPSRSGRRRA